MKKLLLFLLAFQSCFAVAPVFKDANTDTGNLIQSFVVPSGKGITFASGSIFQFNTGATFAGDAAAFRTAIGVPDSTVAVVGTANEVTATTVSGTTTVSLPTALTFTGKTVTGGNYENAVIGATTPQPGHFTSLEATSTVNFEGGALNLTGGGTTGSNRLFIENNSSAYLDVKVYGSTASGTTFGMTNADAAVIATDKIGATYPSALLIGTANTAPIVLGVNGAETGRVTSTGYQGVIGATTPAAGTFTTIAATSGTVSSAPSASTDIVNKAYADSLSGGIKPQTSVLVATTANITLSGAQTIDGVAVVAGNRVLVKNQSTTSQNGIYDAASGAWSRSADSDTAAELAVNNYYFVTSGTAGASTGWFILTAPTVLGTDPVVFSQFSSQLSNFSNIVVTGGTINGATIGATTPAASTFTTLTATGSEVFGTAGTGFNITFKDYNTGTGRPWSLRDDSGVNRLRFSYSSADYAFWDVTKTAAANTIAQQIWASELGYSYLVGGVSKASITSTGINATDIGATTPGAGVFTTISSSSNANIRTTKGNFHLVVNVKDYGALGDGSTNDVTAINLAIAALTNYSVLYFPPGKYVITGGGLTALSSLTYVDICGDGASLYNGSTGAAGNTLVVNSNCSHVNIHDLSFVGAATTRGSGIHIRLYADYSSVTNCYLSGCSDFAIHVNGTGTRIENNTIVAPLGDGIHFGDSRDFVCSGNTISSTGDDGIGVIADTAGLGNSRGLVIGNHIYNSASAGIRCDENDDITIEGNDIHTTAGAGIDVARYLSTTAYNNRIHVKSNKLYNTTTTAGPRGSIWMNFCNESSATENEIYDPANGAGIVVLDFNDMTIRGNTVRGSPSRAIATDDSTTTNVAANWYGLVVDSNVIQYNVANQAIYVVPASGKTVNNVLVTSNVGNQLPTGDWVYYDRVTTGKVGNNTSRDGKSVTAGGTVSGVTTFNNN